MSLDTDRLNRKRSANSPPIGMSRNVDIRLTVFHLCGDLNHVNCDKDFHQRFADLGPNFKLIGYTPADKIVSMFETACGGNVKDDILLE